MNFIVSEISFEGHNKSKVRIRKKHLKRLKAKEAELTEKCKILQADCDVLELPLKRVTSLPYNHPKTPTVSKLWKLCFDAQYSLINDSYPKYVRAKKIFAKEAVKDLDLLKYLTSPIQLRGPISIFSKSGRNITKNKFLDMFRIKTSEEKQLIEYYKEIARKKAMHKSLGIN